MGQAAAKQFAEAGARTFVLGRTLESRDETAALSENITPVACDVADTDSIAKAMGIIGRADLLIHTAGINTADRFITHEDPTKVALSLIHI